MLKHPKLSETREHIRAKKDAIAGTRENWVRDNAYYYGQLISSLKYIIPEGSRVLHVGCSTGFILEKLAPAYAVGVEYSEEQVAFAASKNIPNARFIHANLEDFDSGEKFDYVIVSTVEDIVDVKSVLDRVHACCDRHTRIILINYNFLWEPLVSLAEKLRLKIPQDLRSWVSPKDINDFLRMANFEAVCMKKIILLPFHIPLISYVLNRFVVRLPFFRLFNMMNLTVAKANLPSTGDYSVSVVIPCRNEAGNIEDAVRRVPKLGRHTEIIFGDDKSTDGTADKVLEMIKKYPDKDIKLVPGPGVCKADNVWSCFERASGDILMILDADLTVIPEELPYFYEAIALGYGEYINGSRLVYPMGDKAMPFANMLGNKFFSLFFSYILDTPIKDTLCGTKVLWREDYLKVKKLRGSWGIKDNWGDYEIIFGAAKNHLKMVEVPVHYMDRLYGETKMNNRLKNGLIMLRMCMVSLFKIKFY